MKKWWNYLLAIAILGLLLVAIPISYNKTESNETLQLMFNDYIQKFNKTYRNDPVAYTERFQHFKVNLEEIDILNSESRGPEEHRAHYGLTRLSDMSKTEYKNLHLSDEKYDKPPHLYGRAWEQFKNQKIKYLPDNDLNIGISDKTLLRKKRAIIPLKVDWTAKGVVGAVHNQGLCGACWAFSTVGIIESMAAIKTGTLVPLSVQEAVDCAGLGNSGCSGGDICLLLDWLMSSKTAVVPEKLYPLKLTDGVCQIKKNSTGVRVKTYSCDDFTTSEDKILEAIATHGPVSVAVNALSWQNYLGGVIQFHCSGAPTDLNHAVQLVGYDLTATVPYYLAKNSWGSAFGLSGYLKLAFGTNVCGLANEVASVDVI